VLEFLGAPAVPALYEKDPEQGLLDQLQTFLLELGKGFAFVAGSCVQPLPIKGA